MNLSVDARWTILDGFVFSTTLGGGSISTFGESWFTERTHYIAGIRGYNYGEYDVFDADLKTSPLPYGGELNAVSYTHLDVYKRQVVILGNVQRVG